MRLSAYGNEETVIEPITRPKIEEKNDFNFSEYQFTDSDSYETPQENYEEYDEEERPLDERCKSFVYDDSAKGLFKKWLLVFFILLYIVWASCQYLIQLTSTKEITPSLLPHRIIFNILYGSPAIGLFTGILMAIMASLSVYAFNKKTKPEKEAFKLSKNKTHGSAEFSSDNKMKGAIEFKELSTPEGICLGKKVLDEMNQTMSVCVTANIDRNMNFAIFGSSGSGKSYAFARPNILTRIDRGESFMVTDPSGELYRDTAGIAEAEGYNVKVLNLTNPSASNGWNPFDVLQSADPMEVQMLTASLVHTILSNTADENAKADVFFDQSEENLLKALILYVAVSPHFAGEPHERHMGTVYDLLTKVAAQEGILEEFSPSRLPETDPASAPWKMFQGAGKLKTNFITGLASRLEIFQVDIIKELFSHSEINLSAPGQEKCAYYIISPVTNNKMRFLLSLFFSCAFEQLITDASMSGGKLKIPVFFILDEFKAIGRINSFADKVANVRKYGISLAMIFQDLNQLKQAYIKEYSSILSNCDTWLALGVNDLETAEQLSKRAGISTVEATTEQHQQLKHAPISPVDPMMKYSKSDQRRNLMNPDEIMNYFDNMGESDRKAIIFARSKNPYLINTYDWHLHKLAKFVPENQREAFQYIPPWQRGEWTLNKKRTFLTSDTNSSTELSYGGKVNEKDTYKEKARGREVEETNQDKAKKKPGGIVFNSDAKSTHLVELGLDLTGKKKV